MYKRQARLLHHRATLIFDVDINASIPASAVQNSVTMRSAEDATPRSLATIRSFWDQPLIQPDTSADTVTMFASFTAGARWGPALNGGSLVVTDSHGFSAGGGEVNAGVTITNRRGLMVRVPGISGGEIVNQYAIDIETMTAATGKNRAIRMQGAGGIEFADSTEPTGALGSSAEGLVYFRNKKLIFKYNDGGTVRYKYLDLSGTGVTWVHTTSAP